jgi:hypothetical protein
MLLTARYARARAASILPSNASLPRRLLLAADVSRGARPEPALEPNHRSGGVRAFVGTSEPADASISRQLLAGDYCERGVDEVEWQGGRVYLHLGARRDGPPRRSRERGRCPGPAPAGGPRRPRSGSGDYSAPVRSRARSPARGSGSDQLHRDGRPSGTQRPGRDESVRARGENHQAARLPQACRPRRRGGCVGGAHTEWSRQRSGRPG